MSPEAARLAVLVSGGGRSVENLAQVIAGGELDAEIVLVLSDRPGSGALARAERLGLPSAVIEYAALPREGRVDEFARLVEVELKERRCDLVVLAGFLRLLRLPRAWNGRVINIHPALLPDFGGKGYYGARVHAAVLASGVTETGCTVHLVDDEYDHGPILLQRRVPVLAGDTVDSLAARVFEEEKRALPEAIRSILAGE